MTSLRQHWPEYVIEAGALASFMVSATLFATLLQHPASPLSSLIPNSALGRVPMGVAMGLTAVAIIYSPFGRRSGAHMNPVVTLTFFRLGKVSAADAIGYVAAQFAGGVFGTVAASLALRGLPADPSVHFIATLPGISGAPIAFIAEAMISFALMLTVLLFSSHDASAPFTGIAAGLLVAIYIVIEAPLSGMSMNPARTFGPALFTHSLDWLWLYISAPLLGMLSAAELFVRIRGFARVRCAKLHHTHGVRCIFRCGHPPSLSESHV